MKVKLTEDVIARIKPYRGYEIRDAARVVHKIQPGRAFDIRDTGQPGLLVRVYATGKAAFAVSFGRGRVMVLAPTSKLTVEDARTEAKARLGEDAKGQDPIAEKRRKRAASLRTFLEGPFKEWAVAKHRDGHATVDRVLRAFPTLLDKRLTEITAFAVEAWRTKRHKDGITASTTNREIAALKGVLSRALDWGAMPGRHPLKSVKVTSVDKFARVRYLSDAEEKRLLAALDARETDHREARARFNEWRKARGFKPVPDFPADQYVDHIQPLVVLAMNTGARRGELLGLRWADVDLVARMLTIRGTTAKTGHTRRVPLNATALAALNKWKPEHPDAAALVFPGDRGKAIQSVKTAFTALLKDAQIKGFRFHDLRHHAASRMVQQGTDLFVVSQVLGHKSTLMTQRYAHLSNENLVAAVAKLG